MLPTEKHYLIKIAQFIYDLYSEPQDNSEYTKGYGEALSDLVYACKLGKEALYSHLIIWSSFVALNDNDSGYVSACSDVLKEVSKINESDKWSFN